MVEVVKDFLADQFSAQNTATRNEIRLTKNSGRRDKLLKTVQYEYFYH